MDWIDNQDKEQRAMCTKNGPEYDVVTNFVAFQNTGEGFDAIWNEIQPIVADFAGRSLKRLGIKVSHGMDDWAMAEVINDTSLTLLELALPGAKGRFDPSRAKPGLSGLRGWLWRVVESRAAEWARNFRGGRGLKMLSENCLEWNDLSGDQEGDSVIGRLVAKIERPDLLPILEDCIASLDDPFQQTIVRRKLYGGSSLRATGNAIGVGAATVHRQLQDAFTKLRMLLEKRGVDVVWLAV